MATDLEYRLLFLSLRNSMRSLLAEAPTNHLAKGRFTGASAGLEPSSANDALAHEVLRVAGIHSEGLHPKHWHEFAREGSPAFEGVGKES